VVALEREQFAHLAIDRWLAGLSSSTISARYSAFRAFRKRTGLDPVDLLFQSRRTQNPDPIIVALRHFHESLIADGYDQKSSEMYFNAVLSFFTANRAPMPRIRPVPVVPIGGWLFDGDTNG